MANTNTQTLLHNTYTSANRNNAKTTPTIDQTNHRKYQTNLARNQYYKHNHDDHSQTCLDNDNHVPQHDTQ